MTAPRRRQAGEGGISEYQTAAGTRFLIKFQVTAEDGTRRQKLRRGFVSRKDAARENNPADKAKPPCTSCAATPAACTTKRWLSSRGCCEDCSHTPPGNEAA